MEKILPLLGIFAMLLGAVLVFVLAIRWARKSSGRAALLGWGLQFLGVGMNPLPPPQEQLDAANREAKIKKTSESGDPEA